MQNPSNKEGFFVLYFRGWVIGYNVMAKLRFNAV